MMRLLTWLFRAVLFVFLLTFAVKNDQPVALHYYFGYDWQTSLVVVLLAFFMAGVAVGLIAMLTSLLRQRKEISTLKRELMLNSRLAAAGEPQVQPGRSGERIPGTD